MSIYFSDEYQELLQQYRQQRPDWGNTGYMIADEIYQLMIDCHYVSILDYGCGDGSLKRAILQNPPPDLLYFDEYDPGVEGKEICPDNLYDLVVCKDVLEHVEPEYLDNVLVHLARLTGKMLWCKIAYIPSPAVLPDGQNAHRCLLTPYEWKQQLSDYFGIVVVNNEDHQHCWFICRQPFMNIRAKRK